MDGERRRSGDKVQHELERLILSGELPPGTHATEQLLAERLGLGRTAVREACAALERAGLLRRVPNRGFFVRQVSLSSATDVFDIRAELSGIVAREAVHNVTAPTVEALQALIVRMDAAAAAAEAAGYLGLNVEFHERLYSLADNRRVAELDRRLGAEMLVYRHRGLASGGGLQHSNAEHRRILEALLRGRGEALAEVLYQHIINGKRRFLRAIGPELGPDRAPRLRSRARPKARGANHHVAPGTVAP